MVRLGACGYSPLEVVMTNPLITDEQALVLIGELSNTATSLQADALQIAPLVQVERARFEKQEISLEEMSFWLKSLVHAVLPFAEGLCSNIREVMTRHADKLQGRVTPKQLAALTNKSQDPPLERALSLTFRTLPVLFGVSYEPDTSGADFRAFKEMLRARAAFTHPKTPPDIHPLELIATVNSGLEWLLHAWRDLLLACAARVRDVSGMARGTKKFPFNDQRLADFRARAKELAEAEERKGEVFGALSRMIFGLMDDTKRAELLVTDKSGERPLPSEVAFRNLARFLFSEIEGSVFIAAYYLYRYGFVDEKPQKELLIGSHEEVRDRIIDTLETFSRYFGVDYRVPRDSAGWDAFSAARGLRNRLVHPKDALAFQFRNGDLDQLLATRNWWCEEVHGCLSLSVNQDERKIEELVRRMQAGLRTVED